MDLALDAPYAAKREPLVRAGVISPVCPDFKHTRSARAVKRDRFFGYIGMDTIFKGS